MNSSCAFYIGTTHDVCQDYALALGHETVISDGCSGSPLSDVGSRVLSVTAMNKIAQLESIQDFDGKECILLARPALKMLNLPEQCLDATLFAIKATEERVGVVAYGDGVIAMKHEEGIVIVAIEYEKSFPFYLNYFHSLRYNEWMTEHNNRKVTVHFIKNNGDVEDCDMEDNQFGIIEEEFRVRISCPNRPEIEWIAVMSDGIMSFSEKTPGQRKPIPISYIEVLKELLPFKNFAGSFTQRRINKFRKNCAKKNWHNSDDVSLAATYLGEQTWK